MINENLDNLRRRLNELVIHELAVQELTTAHIDKNDPVQEVMSRIVTDTDQFRVKIERQLAKEAIASGDALIVGTQSREEPVVGGRLGEQARRTDGGINVAGRQPEAAGQRR